VLVQRGPEYRLLATGNSYLTTFFQYPQIEKSPVDLQTLVIHLWSYWLSLTSPSSDTRPPIQYLWHYSS